MKERILIVDDEASVRKLIQTVLRKEGYECSIASDAQEARALLDAHPFHLVLTDIMMPGESGLALMRYISETYPDTGIVMVTAVDDPETAKHALGYGVYGYVVKPFEPSQILITTVNALKRRELEIQARAYTAGLEETVRERTEELRRTVHALEQTRQHYQDLFEQSLDAIYAVSRDGRFLEINPAGLDLLGYSREEIKGLNVQDTYARPKDREAFRERIETAGFVRDYELRLKNKGGEEMTCLVSATLRRDNSGLVVGYQGILRDITAQEQMEKRLRQAHRENVQILAAVPSLLIGIDSGGRVIRWNKGSEDILGILSSEVLHRKLADHPIPWDWAMVQEGMAASRRYQEPVRLDDVPFTKPDGSKGYLGVSLSPILFEDAAEPGILVMGADITEKRQLEIQLSQAQRLEAIGQLAAGIAHEINTPTQYVGDNTRFLGEAFETLVSLLDEYGTLLEAVRSGASVASVEETARAVEATFQEADLDYLREEIPAAVEQTLEGVERVTRIVRSMKDFSHPGTGEMTSVDLNRALENTITVARNEWKYVAEMETDLDPELPLVPCLPGELNQVFLNLIVNAAHAIEEMAGNHPKGKGTIRVSTRRAGDLVEVCISDTGPGIPVKDRDRIFDPFFTTKEVGKGTGQGLAISRSVVVDKHGGRISFETEEGQGTTFVVRLPVSQDRSHGKRP